MAKTKGNSKRGKRVNFYLTLEQIEAIKTVKRKTGLTQSAIMRKALADWLMGNHGIETDYHMSWGNFAEVLES